MERRRHPAPEPVIVNGAGSEPPSHDRLVSARMWNVVLFAVRDAARRSGCDTSVVVFTVEGATRALDATRIERLVLDSTRACDVLGWLGTTRLALIAVGCGRDDAAGVAERVVAVLAANGVDVDVSLGAATDDLARDVHGGDVAAAAASHPAAGRAVSEYAPCNACEKRGVYVSGRYPVMRCKYCGVKVDLTEAQWRGAPSALAELARVIPTGDRLEG